MNGISVDHFLIYQKVICTAWGWFGSGTETKVKHVIYMSNREGIMTGYQVRFQTKRNIMLSKI